MSTGSACLPIGHVKLANSPSPLPPRWFWISQETIAYFQLRFDPNWLRYPILDVDGTSTSYSREKRLCKDATLPKYRFDRSGNKQAYYHPAGFRYAEQQDGTLIIASGEPIVWLLWELGLPNTICWFGESQKPASLLDQLKAHHIKRVYAFTDRDKTGDGMAAWLKGLLEPIGIEFLPLEVPGEWAETSGPDLDDWIRACLVEHISAAEIRDRIFELPPWTPTGLEPNEPLVREPLSWENHEQDEWVEIQNRTWNEIHLALQPRRGKENRPGYYECPQDHDHVGKDFLFDPMTGCIGGCQGKHKGQLSRWKDLAAHLGIDVSEMARGVRVEFASRREAEAKARNKELQRIWKKRCQWPAGVPRPLAEVLLAAHLFLGKVSNQGPLVLALVLWDQMVTMRRFSEHACFTLYDLEEAARSQGHTTSRGTIERGLKQGVELGFFRKSSVLSTVMHSKSPMDPTTASGPRAGAERGTKGPNSAEKSRGRPKQYYTAVPLMQAVPCALEWLGSRTPTEVVPPEAPATIQAEQNKRRRLNKEARLYAQRARAWQYRQLLASLAQRDLQQVADGPTIQIPLGETLKNAPRLRDILQYQDIAQSENGKRQVSVSKQCLLYGVSHSTIRTMRERNGVLATGVIDSYKISAEGSAVEQMNKIRKNALDFPNGMALFSTYGKHLTLSWALTHHFREEDYTHWVQARYAEGEEVYLMIQRASIEHIATPEEWEEHLRKKAGEVMDSQDAAQEPWPRFEDINPSEYWPTFDDDEPVWVCTDMEPLELDVAVELVLDTVDEIVEYADPDW